MNGYRDDTGFFEDNMEQGDQGNRNTMLMMGHDERDSPLGGRSLDEIVNRNAKVIRRLSEPQYNNGQNGVDGTDMRPISMMGYDAASAAGNLGGFQYDSNAGLDQSTMMAGNATQSQNQHHRHASQQQSHNDLTLNTSFPNASQSYNSMAPPNSAYQTSAHSHSGLDMSMDGPYGMDLNMDMQMEYKVDQGMENVNYADGSHMSTYSQPQFNQSLMSPPLPSGTTTSSTSQFGRRNSPDSGGDTGIATSFESLSNSTGNNTVHHLSRLEGSQMSDMQSPAMNGDTLLSQANLPAALSHTYVRFPNPPRTPITGSQDDGVIGNGGQPFDGLDGPIPVNATNHNPNNQGFKWETPNGGWPSTMVGRPNAQSEFKNAYSATGFDMLGVLMRVATRPQPEINIGSVDLSCSFVVCDAEKDDCPIVYCSDNFERLTGYTKHMILGRNCRFLQSPDGVVEAGIRRKYVDDQSVMYLKNMISLQREAQISLINYRRGGQPFMNLLTMIPIRWDSDQVKFFVGFQVDLVEQPNAVTDKNPDGSYSINYQRGMTMPRYVLNPPNPSKSTELGQTISRDDVSTILGTFGSGESEHAKRMWDKVLLENTDDVVHVLSLKGLFQWISPSAVRVLEYEPSEIIGTALSSICHPSDIVPVTRELKDTSSGAAVNFVFRIRRKQSGYMWFEGHGSLHTEQGKGRKSIILVGRERPVYSLSKSEIVKAGGIGENEIWAKMSTSGMFLFVSSNVRQLLDRQPEDLVGVSIQSLMRTDSKAEFGRILEHARSGKRASVKHEMINRRGQVLSAFTTLYPGDATEGLKPTFVIAQTRLLRFSRSFPPSRPPLYQRQEHHSADSMQSGVTSNQQIDTSSQQGDRMSGSAVSSNHYVGTSAAPITFAGQNSLMIGHQDVSLASEDNLFDELKTTKSSSWQYEIRQLEKQNRMMAEEVQTLIASRKKRKRRRGKDQQKDCVNCHTMVTPEWRRGPSGQRDLCNSCGLRWAKANGRVSPRTSSEHSVRSIASDKASKASASPLQTANILPRSPMVKIESPGQTASISDKATPGRGSVEPPKVARPAEGHARSMEGASRVPDKIEEDIEPD